MTKKSESGRLKQELKEDKDTDPALYARDRLRGALQELLHSDHSTDSEDYKAKLLSQKKVEKERPAVTKKKRISKLPSNKTQGFPHSFVMKLFDRSVDLAQFDEKTPLYPICRAWIANKPRSLGLERDFAKKIKKEERKERNKKNSEEDLNKKDVYALPLPIPLAPGQPRIPVFDKNLTKDLDEIMDQDKPVVSRDVLLSGHLSRWTNVKKVFRSHSYDNEQRYLASDKILRRIFNSAQKNFSQTDN